MKKVNSRGIKQANKHVLMAAMTYNLKKYMRFSVKKPTIKAQAVAIEQGKVHTFLKMQLYALKTAFLSHAIFIKWYLIQKINLA